MRLREVAFVTGLFLASINAASADVVFDVSQVAVSTGGYLSGSFTLTDDLTDFVTFDIIAPSADGFAGYEYTLDNVTLLGLKATSVRLTATGDTRLFLNFSALTTSGATLAATSYEGELSEKRGLSGSIAGPDAASVATPEPASLALLGTGLAGMCLLRKRGTPERMRAA